MLALFFWGLFSYWVFFPLRALVIYLIDQKRPLIWSTHSRGKFLIHFSDQPYFRPFKTKCPILSHIFLTCHIRSFYNLCRFSLLFYLSWYVFHLAKKENKVIRVFIIRFGHGKRWPYFRPFKTFSVVIVVVVTDLKKWITFICFDRFGSNLVGSCIRVRRFTSYPIFMIWPPQPAQPAYQPKSEKHA